MLNTAGARRLRDQRGTVLLLMPAAVLVMFVLAAIAVDLTAIHSRQRDLQAAAVDAANDAATAGLDEDAIRSGQGYRIDRTRAGFTALRVLDAKGIVDDLDGSVDVRVDDDGTVTVHLSRRVPHLFAHAIPGAPDSQWVEVTATAHVEQR